MINQQSPQKTDSYHSWTCPYIYLCIQPPVWEEGILPSPPVLPPGDTGAPAGGGGLLGPGRDQGGDGQQGQQAAEVCEADARQGEKLRCQLCWGKEERQKGG